MSVISRYQNGNAGVRLYEDGTRVIQFDGNLQLDYPLNIDIRVSTSCSFGFNPSTGKCGCGFCHESSVVNGKECDYSQLKQKLRYMPRGIELAIGSNEFTQGLYDFLLWCKYRGFISNITINQGHIKRDRVLLNQGIVYGLINGLGVSYRSNMKWDIPDSILDYTNTVFHVIAGIDSIEDVMKLKDRGVKKILVLGEKDFGFNSGRVNLMSQSHKEWYWWIHKLFDTFDVVSFDNLALEQLNIKRFFTQDKWDEFNQGEHSFYINAVEGYFAPSSRSDDKTDWNLFSIPEYFQLNEMQQEENR